MNYFFELKKDINSESDQAYFELQARKHIERMILKSIQNLNLSSCIKKIEVSLDSINEVIKLNIDSVLNLSGFINKMLKSESSLEFFPNVFEIDCQTNFFNERLIEFLLNTIRKQCYYPHNPELSPNEIFAAKRLIMLINDFNNVCKECYFYSYETMIILSLH